ncbi:MAG: hypothetical protein K8T10_02330 [Candidatus Eremiobacteraeota bacterium]|nr:hypothetical protein [Candidatus Eremiobacteraeota bacterium]
MEKEEIRKIEERERKLPPGNRMPKIETQFVGGFKNPRYVMGTFLLAGLKTRATLWSE